MRRVVQLLLENGAELESEEYGGQTPLSLAAWTGQKAVVRLLLEKGADVESKSSRSGTLLSLAAWAGQEAVVRLLIDGGADVKIAMMWAAARRYKAVVQLLQSAQGI